MNSTQLRVLIWDTFFNDPQLRKMLTVDDAYRIQEQAIKHAERLELLEDTSKPVESDADGVDSDGTANHPPECECRACALSVPASGLGSNTGHGHVWERPDGMKARCGGYPRCRECRLDMDMYG